LQVVDWRDFLSWGQLATVGFIDVFKEGVGAIPLRCSAAAGYAGRSFAMQAGAVIAPSR